MQCIDDRSREVLVSTETQGISDGVVVVAKHCVSTVFSRRRKTAHGVGDVLNVAESLVHEVAGEYDEVRSLGGCGVDGVGEVMSGQMSAAVQIGKLHDPKVVKVG